MGAQGTFDAFYLICYHSHSVPGNDPRNDP